VLRFKGFAKNEEAFHCEGDDCLQGVHSNVQEYLDLVQPLVHGSFGLAANPTAEVMAENGI
jgi:hypothetical protein